VLLTLLEREGEAMRERERRGRESGEEREKQREKGNEAEREIETRKDDDSVLHEIRVRSLELEGGGVYVHTRTCIGK
jgi:hypothetical protein